MGFDELYTIPAIMITDKHLALQRARAAGTIDELDRSRQYTEPDLQHVLASLNEAWTKIRVGEKALMAKDAQIAVLKKELESSQSKVAWLRSIIVFAGSEILRALVPWLMGVLR